MFKLRKENPAKQVINIIDIYKEATLAWTNRVRFLKPNK